MDAGENSLAAMPISRVLKQTFALANMANALLAKGQRASLKDYGTPAPSGAGSNPERRKNDTERFV